MANEDILQTIMARKREELDLRSRMVSQAQLEEQVGHPAPARISMRKSLAASHTGIIAEFKRRSPSKGWINEQADASQIPPAYEAAGASALSVLTDHDFFGGSLKDIRTARPLVQLPILRKDFILSEYQLLQAKVVGADAVLLIAAALSRKTCLELARKAHALHLEVLLEIHEEAELDYVTDEVDMVGVNNRNLGTFHTDVENSFRLATRLPEGKLWVSESGISHPDTVRSLREAGFRGFLIGETFMREPMPGEALARFIHSLKA